MQFFGGWWVFCAVLLSLELFCAVQLRLVGVLCSAVMAVQQECSGEAGDWVEEAGDHLVQVHHSTVGKEPVLTCLHNSAATTATLQG